MERIKFVTRNSANGRWGCGGMGWVVEDLCLGEPLSRVIHAGESWGGFVPWVRQSEKPQRVFKLLAALGQRLDRPLNALSAGPVFLSRFRTTFKRVNQFLGHFELLSCGLRDFDQPFR